MGAVELLLIRHGESRANAAAGRAHLAGDDEVDVGGLRDWDVPLTFEGRLQARAVGLWLAALPRDRRPQSAWCSPYVRARQTAELAWNPAETGRPLRVDERLRDREQGILDLLTGHGVKRRHPEEEARRRSLGRFAYRPPGGESWADVALRARSLMLDLDAAEDGRRVAVFAHDVVILMLRYVCEQLDPEQILAIAGRAGVRNGSVTTLRRPRGTGRWQTVEYNRISHLTDGGAPITEHLQ